MTAGTRVLRALPELGVGFVYWPALAEVLDAGAEVVDVVEVEPQPFWFAPDAAGQPYRVDRGFFDCVRGFPQAALVHGVGLPVGGTVAPDPRQVDAFVESIALLGPLWASEHLSFTRTDESDLGFLLPPVQSAAGVELAAANIAALTARLPVPFAFETGVSYLRPVPGELTDGTFFAAVAERADCGILLDLHNTWANQRNGRQPVDELIDELPLDRVVEVHLAGGADLDGYWVDAHSGLVPSSLMDLAGEVVPRLPNLKAIVFEVMPEYVSAHGITTGQLVDQLRALRRLWDTRGRLARPTRRQAPPTAPAAVPPTPSQWEQALGAAVTGRSGPAPLAADLHTDPGTRVLRTLVHAVRAGTLASTLILTIRLLLTTIGDARLRRVLNDYFDTATSRAMASDEARGFAAHLKTSELAAEVDHLHEVLAYELATHRAVMTGESSVVSFSCDPEPLLAALRRGRRPQELDAGEYLVPVSPRGGSPCGPG